MRLLVVLTLLLMPALVAAGTLDAVDHNTYTGVVVEVGDLDVVFLWQRDRDQPEAVKKGTSDDLYRAMGQEAVVQRVPFSRIERVDGVPLEAWKSLFRKNLFYRAFANLEGARIRAATAGDFMKQIKGIIIFLAFLLVVVPLVLVVASLPFTQTRLGYGAGIGVTIMLTVLGFASAMLARWLATSAGFAQSDGGQLALSVVLGLVIAAIVHFVTRYGFWQGLVFTVVWSGAFVFSGRAVMWALGGIPDAPSPY